MAVWPRRGVAERRRDLWQCTGRRDGSGRAGRRAGHPGRVLRMGAQAHAHAARRGVAPCVSSRKEEKGREKGEKKKGKEKKEKRKKGEKEKGEKKKERGEKEKEAPAGFTAAVGHARALRRLVGQRRSRNEEKREMER